MSADIENMFSTLHLSNQEKRRFGTWNKFFAVNSMEDEKRGFW